MIIECTATDGLLAEPVVSEWTHLPDEPWFVEVDFRGHNSTWLWSVDLLRETLSSSPGSSHGAGDVVMEYWGYGLRVHINVPAGEITLIFEANKVREFLSQVDDSNAEMILGHKLDEFLESL